MTNCVIGLVTCSSRAEAREVARAVLRKKLAACVNVLDGVGSHYWWHGKLEQTKETMLLIKTTKANMGAVTRTIEASHSYDVPEIIAIPIIEGSKKYLKWIDESLRAEGPKKGF